MCSVELALRQSHHLDAECESGFAPFRRVEAVVVGDDPPLGTKRLPTPQPVVPKPRSNTRAVACKNRTTCAFRKAAHQWSQARRIPTIRGTPTVRFWFRPSKGSIMELSRRRFIQMSAVTGASGAVLFDALQAPAAFGVTQLTVGDNPYGPLLEPDSNGFALPKGFSSKLLATSDELVGNSEYKWHWFPDGGAVFAQDDGGWIYVSNSEVPAVGKGGAGALRFDADGEIVDAYSILDGTDLNCGGAHTPQGTWLSCEETEGGRVFECFPDASKKAIERPEYGRFPHEAAAVDPVNNIVYLTEDRPDGRFYRVPDGGVLQAAKVASDGTVSWLDVPDPLAAQTPTRQQLAETTAFLGGEGIWYHEKSKLIYFVTKGDNKVWVYDGKRVDVYHDPAKLPTSPVSTVDNIVMNRVGDMVICEDQDDEQQLVIITATGTVATFAQLHGHKGSELAGIAFSPAGDRVYVSSQRGGNGTGATYEIVGPFVDEQPPVVTTTVGSTVPSPPTTAATSPEDDDDFPVVPVIGGAAAVVVVGAAALLRLRNRGSAE